MYIYENQIKKIGKLAQEFGDEVIILFGDNAPSTLEDYSYIIDIKNIDYEINTSDILFIGYDKYEILAIGDIAQQNLINLGHLAINFTSDTNALLPGSIVVKGEKKPKLEIGTEIKIYRK